MLTPNQKKNLKSLLAISEEPDITFTYDELLGYLFGLAITPDVIDPSEWMVVIFGSDLPEFQSMKQMRALTGNLIDCYNNFLTDFQKHKLNFPFNIDDLTDSQLTTLFEWVSGFEEALALREELWDPEEYPELSDQKKAELYHSMMTIEGLVDPMEVTDYFEEMPDEIFQEAFQGMGHEFGNREIQIQVFLMASLPLAISTFQEHAFTLEKKRQGKLGPRAFPPPQSIKTGHSPPCSCGSDKKSKTCCDSNQSKASFSVAGKSSKKSNVIKVDFSEHGKKKKKKVSPAPIYQLKVALQGAKPPIWRRIQVPGNFTLEQLHEVIQISMGWTDSHLHQFLIDRTCYSLPDEDDLWQTSRPKNEAKYTLQDLEKKIQPHFQYIYDFGDDWMHQITVEKLLPPDEGFSIPKVITGRRACPPEDVGGIYGYMHLLEVVNDPENEEYEQINEWLDLDSFDPASFNKIEIQEINEILEKLFSSAK